MKLNRNFNHIRLDLPHHLAIGKKSIGESSMLCSAHAVKPGSFSREPHYVHTPTDGALLTLMSETVELLSQSSLYSKDSAKHSWHFIEVHHYRAVVAAISQYLNTLWLCDQNDLFLKPKGLRVKQWLLGLTGSAVLTHLQKIFALIQRSVH